MINMKVETIINTRAWVIYVSCQVETRPSCQSQTLSGFTNFPRRLMPFVFPLSPRNVELLLLDKETRVRRLKCPCLRLRLRRLKWLTLTLILTGPGLPPPAVRTRGGDRPPAVMGTGSDIKPGMLTQLLGDELWLEGCETFDLMIASA